MDVIYIEDLEVYAHHGVNQAEKDMGQKFLISLKLYLDLRDAGKHDDLSSTINYAVLCNDVEGEFKKKKYDLIETSAEVLSEFILKKYARVKRVKVRVKKPWAPIGKPLKWAAIEVDRRWHRTYISVGSNLGDREQNIKDAVHAINSSDSSRIVKMSKLYETKPVGYLKQGDFLNGALELETLLTPEELIDFLMQVEKKLKRERKIKWGPRTLDLDVVLYDNLVTADEKIVIPHPRMHKRLFVLKPLCDIAPYVVHPVLNARIIDLTTELEKTEKM
ncbi:2-amino-4-hydroxy-6-hydroxymethyldihydropteridine diphosphokinase [Clostridium luticellarii]|jgi:dihydroneopterin aldolase/2-amino-4-hydroxy-6-hydroxymethyldihydropteridine diphosphokinase|uniref:Bifunctional folate synthesis protein n=1 Tax=Clostridium luticellarii TaxID=1691940 RepID=A0A2T0BM26_9CLOT|nr:2-amino-4-hydroxy-6-hydroxymethyldihydropteridine diphosphokinase [Clostridium luticellarii]PRR84937.1 Bifunctional folate synthesis protein [Clostridium luticellarii]